VADVVPRAANTETGADAAPASAPRIEGPGSRIGPYKLLQQVGEGGFGAVFMAEQTEPVVRRVALKVIKLGMDTRQVIARFEAERQALAMMDHPNIARVLDAGATDGGRPYFVMELVRGDPITDYCDKNSLDPDQRLDLFIQICHAVQHAHQKGIIHRDLKPSNVLVTVADGRPIPKVIDFGIAKATSTRLTEKTLFTEHRQLIGTPEYMSPEQAEMTGVDIDTRSDIYSLGVLLYELLTGTTPFDAVRLRSAAFGELQRIIREVEPPRPSTRLSSMKDTIASVAARRHTEPARLARLLRGDLDWIVMKALEKDRTRRYETANGFAMDVQRHLRGEPVMAAPPSALYRVRKSLRRHRVGYGAGAAVFAAMALGLAVSLRLYVLQQRAADRALDAERASRIAADRAEAVSAFLKDMLGSVNPAVAGNRDITVREVLDGAGKRLEAGAMRDQPEVKRELLGTLAASYEGIGKWDTGEHYYREALAAAATVRGDDSDEALHARLALADNLMRLSRQGDASTEYQRVIDGTAARPALRSLRAQAMVGLADALGHKGDYAQAERLFREAVTELRAADPNSIELARALCSQGWAYKMMERYAEAEACLRESIELHQRRPGPPDPDLFSAMNNLGVTLGSAGKLSESEEVHCQTLSRRRALLGENHPDTIPDIANLATVVELQGRFDEAEALHLEALQRVKAVLGSDHGWTASASNNLGLLRMRMGKLPEAQASLEESLACEERRGRLATPDVAMTRQTLAMVLLAQGEAAKAEQSAAASRAVFTQTLGAKHWRTLFSEFLRATALIDLGRLGEARPIIEATLKTPEDVIRPSGGAYWEVRIIAAWLDALESAGTKAVLDDAERRLLEAYTKLPAGANAQFARNQARLRIARFYELRDKASPGVGYAVQAAQWRTPGDGPTQRPAPSTPGDR
jgi:serine/threonine protein kinase/tetratricopeptide (TPR) repeat protein